MKISAIIIAKNEESNLDKCLKSMIDIFDDIVIIIDSSSVDKTLLIAKSYENVNYEVRDWQGYSQTKSYAVSKTKNDWVFWIDADEELTKDLAEELKAFTRYTPKYNCYDVARRAYFLGKWIKYSGWYPGRIKRFFNKKSVRFDDKQVHEGLIVEGEIGNLKSDLNHYTDPSIEHYFTKFNDYTSLAAKELNAKKRTVSLRDILLRPLFIFLKMYILRRGFLDGIHGFILAIFSSLYVFAKYCKLWELSRKK